AGMSSSEDDGGQLVVKEEEFTEEMWAENQARRSAFLPYKTSYTSNSVTVLTNLQRGNIQTQTTQVEPEEYTIHTRAALGELAIEHITDIDVNEPDENGFTPLMWASSYGQLPTVRQLLQHRAAVDIEGEDGETALLLACANGHHECVKMLLSCGANPNHIDHISNSGLMYAAHSDHSHCVNELLDVGADMTLTNMMGSSAFTIAVTRGSKQVQLVLERFMLKLVEPS
ncbi:unnamed protein product, partial [Meganyctiphanes norvegica]